MDPALNFGPLAGIVQAIKGLEMAVRGVRQSGVSLWMLACMSLRLDFDATDAVANQHIQIEVTTTKDKCAEQRR